MAELIAGVRTDVAQVRDIITTILSDAQVSAMINTAHTMVENRLGTSGLDTTLLGQIETWLAAHYVCIRDPRKTQMKLDNMSVAYEGKTDMGLSASTYGQQALTLDTTGKLASAGLKRATIHME